MALPDLGFDHQYDGLRELWQSRALRDPSCGFKLINGGLFVVQPLGAVVLSVFCQQWDEAMPTLLAANFPGFTTVMPPFLVEAGKINKWGKVTAQAFMKPPDTFERLTLFEGERHMEYHFRRLADRLKLNDADRWQLFSALKFWVVQDRRLDPTMDPANPDAKRLTVH